jgi:hypothetical protein
MIIRIDYSMNIIMNIYVGNYPSILKLKLSISLQGITGKKAAIHLQKLFEY